MGKKIIAIIGGGAAGLSAFYQLVELATKKNEKDLKIIVIEKSNKIGSGLAYSTDVNSPHILNLPASAMSPIPNHPNHFIQWLQNSENEHKWRLFFPSLDINESAYLPRALFGIYLHDLAETTQQRALAIGIEAEFIYDEAIDIDLIKEDQTEIKLLNHVDPITADKAILCIGHLPPSQKEYKKFKSLEQYYETPWQTKPNMTEIPLEENVIILGTRLTAIDAILTRTATIEKAIQSGYSGPVGKIFAVSRNGLLPCVIGPTQEYQRSKLTLEKIADITAGGTEPLKLKDLKKLFKEEVQTAHKQVTGKEIKLHLKEIFTKNSKTSPTEWLQREISSSKQYSRPWQTVLASLYSIVPSLWKVLDSDDKQMFLDTYYSIWMTYLAAFPLENAEKILALLQKENLAVLGGLKTVSFCDETQMFTAHLNTGNTQKSQIEARYLINATGPGHDLTKTDSVLLQNLIRKNLLSPHPLGGVHVHFKSLQSSVNGNKTIPIFVIGDGGTWGTCMATADLGQTAKQAQRVINSMFFKTSPKISPKNSMDSDSSHSAASSSSAEENNTLSFSPPRCYVGLYTE